MLAIEVQRPDSGYDIGVLHLEDDRVRYEGFVETEFRESAPRFSPDGPGTRIAFAIDSYEITADGRFLMVKDPRNGPEPVTEIHVMIDWLEGLGRRLPGEDAQ